MKKDIEWLKEEIGNFVEPYDTRDLLTYRAGVVDMVEHMLLLINQLDEPEILSQGWIDEHVVYADVRGGTQEFIHVNDLQNLLVPKQGVTGEQLVNYAMDNDLVVFEKDKLDAEVQRMIDEAYKTMNEKPVIPKFVAEWIEKHREHDSNVWHLMYNVNAQDVELWTWIWGENNVDELARAWLDGFTVEEVEKEPVDFMTAIKALNDGKVIYTIRTDGYREVFNPAGKQTDWGVAVEQSQGYAVDTETILYGKWYIED